MKAQSSHADDTAAAVTAAAVAATATAVGEAATVAAATAVTVASAAAAAYPKRHSGGAPVMIQSDLMKAFWIKYVTTAAFCTKRKAHFTTKAT